MKTIQTKRYTGKNIYHNNVSHSQMNHVINLGEKSFCPLHVTIDHKIPFSNLVFKYVNIETSWGLFLTHSPFSIEFIFKIIGYFDVRIKNGPASELLDEFYVNKLNLHRHHLNIYLLYSTPYLYLYLYLYLCWL